MGGAAGLAAQPLPTPPTTQVPLLSVLERVLLGGLGLGKPFGPLHSRDSEAAIVQGGMFSLQPQGEGPLSVPQTSRLCALHQGPSWPSPVRPSEQFTGFPGQVTEG